jgi:hypothetical protein
VGDLLESARNGFESCALILKGQGTDAGGGVHLDHDDGPFETQIIARGVLDQSAACRLRSYLLRSGSSLGHLASTKPRKAFLGFLLSLGFLTHG